MPRRPSPYLLRPSDIFLALIYGAWMAVTTILLIGEEGVPIAVTFLAGHLFALLVFTRLYVLSAKRGWTRYLTAGAFAFVFISQLLVLAYRIVAAAPLDTNFIYDNRSVLWATARVMLDLPFTALSILAITCSTATLGLMLRRSRAVRSIGTRSPPLRVMLLFAAGWELIAPGTLPLALLPNVLHRAPYTDTSQPDVLVPSFGSFRPQGGESVFMLQLESVNAMALEQLGSAEWKRIDPAGSFRAAIAEGIYAPYMWGASVQTHRGLSAILCGAVVDIGQGLTFRLSTGTCLPTLLKNNGYRTVFMSAFWDGGFYNLDRFLRRIGFDEQQFGTMMQHRDRLYDWGYDDCRFHKRAFDYLEEKYGNEMNERFFAFFEVSSNHAPFKGHEAYRRMWPYQKPTTFHQKYINSFAMQAYCAGVFLERVEKFRDRAHVIILADHSYPVGAHGSKINGVGAANENFLIPFLYLPPKGDGRYKRGTTIDTLIPGQTDITPTVLELLSGEAYPNSFASLLRKDGALPEAGYDDCQIVTQPYDGMKVAVIRAQRKLTYEAARRRILASDISYDLEEDGGEIMATDVDYRDFKTRYFCDRYRNLTPPPLHPACQVGERSAYCE